jgi:peptidyl-prolyl cis-trans isomerase C
MNYTWAGKHMPLTHQFIQSAIACFALLFSVAAVTTSMQASAQSYPASSNTLKGDEIIASVNGQFIATRILDEIERQLQSDQADINRSDIVNQLIDLTLLAQQAKAEQLDTQPKISASLQLYYTQTMANAYLDSLAENIQISDEAVRAEYDAQIAQLKRTEYRAQHILLSTSAEAKDVIAKLNDGGSFTDLATTYSTGPSALQGGDLGWFEASTMVAEFSDALTALDMGRYTTDPVQTQYGWHVIQLNDKRAGSMPDFNSVKAGIKNLLLRNELNKAVAELRSKATITRQ